MEPGTLSPLHIGWHDAGARVGAALLLSLALGIERFVHRKPIDLRPFLIIALTSCALAIAITEFAYRESDPDLSIDPAKVISGIMTGIGFLAASALFRERRVVQGAGSAAAIWASGAIGIVCGLGFLWLAALMSAGVLVTLVASRPLTARYAAGIKRDASGDAPDQGAGQ